MEKVHHSAADGPIFLDRFTRFTINLGRLWLPNMADVCNGTAKFVYVYIICGFLLQNIHQEKTSS